MAAAQGPSVRVILRVCAVVAAFVLTLGFVYQVRSVVVTLFIAIFFAIAIGPIVDFWQSRFRFPRALAILASYLSLFATIVAIGLIVVPPVVTQVNGLADDLPGYIDELRTNKQFQEYDQKYGILDKLEEEARKLPNRLDDAAGALESVTVGVFSALTQLITVLTITFFLLLEGGRLVDAIFRLLGPVRGPRVRKVSEDIYRAVSGYVAGNLVISAIAGTVTYVTLSLLGVPFAAPLAILMAFLDLIPLIGATLGGIAIGLVTVFNDFPTATIVWLVVLFVYQQVENSVLQPVVYRKTVAVPPLLVIVAILIGSSLLGVLGALVAIPVAAAVQIVARDLWAERKATAEELLTGIAPDPIDGDDLPPYAAGA